MQYPEEKKNQRLNKRWRDFFPLALGGLSIGAGLAILGLIYWPLFKEETHYLFSAKGKGVLVAGKNEIVKAENGEVAVEEKIMRPVDEEFGLVIPKISANAKVIPEVDPDNSAIYQRALTRGVAHAKGTGYPGKEGNVFIFAHSGVDLPEALRFNAVFYLLNKMEVGDEIFLFRDGQKFRYLVKAKKVVNEDEAGYMDGQPGAKTATLMTCWPPGTTLKRLLVISEIAE